MGEVEKTNDKKPKKKVILEVDEEESIILNSMVKAFTQYDKDDPKYVTKLKTLEDDIHNLWILLHPS